MKDKKLRKFLGVEIYNSGISYESSGKKLDVLQRGVLKNKGEIERLIRQNDTLVGLMSILSDKLSLLLDYLGVECSECPKDNRPKYIITKKGTGHKGGKNE